MNKKVRIVLIVSICICIMLCLTGCNKDKENEKKDKIESNNLIIGNWQEQEIEDINLHNKLIDGLIDLWYNEESYHSDNVLNDIKIFKNPENSNFYFLASAKMYIKETYKNDGTLSYKISNDESSSLENVYVIGYLYEEDGTLKNNEYTFGSFYAYANKEYNDVFNFMLDYTQINQEELVCVNSNNFVNELKECISNNDNIYANMESLLKQGSLDEAQNLYFKNTKITRGQSEKCLILYLKYYYMNYSESLTKDTNKSVTIQNCSASSKSNTETEEKNDYIITIKMKYNGYDLIGERVNKDTSHIFYVTLDVDNKKYEMTNSIW